MREINYICRLDPTPIKVDLKLPSNTINVLMKQTLNNILILIHSRSFLIILTSPFNGETEFSTTPNLLLKISNLSLPRGLVNISATFHWYYKISNQFRLIQSSLSQSDVVARYVLILHNILDCVTI
jgi:hypothetical protein